MDDCIFCKIANGQIPSDFLFEDENAVAFRDLNPLAPTHVLVVPKAHHANIADGVPAQTLSSMFRAVEEVARVEGIDARGFRVVSNAGADAGQAVGHLHLHVLGGRRLTDDFA